MGRPWVTHGSRDGRPVYSARSWIANGSPMGRSWITEGSPISLPSAYKCIWPIKSPMGHAWVLVGTHKSNPWVRPMGRPWVAHGSAVCSRCWPMGHPWVAFRRSVVLVHGSPMGHSWFIVLPHRSPMGLLWASRESSTGLL